MYFRYVTKHYGFFKRMGVPEDSPSFPYGSEAAWKVFTGKESAVNSFKVSISETCHLEYITLPSQDHRGQFTKERFWGMYTFGQRNLVVTDVELGKLITIKDADHFVDRSTGLYVRLLITEIHSQGSFWSPLH